MPMTRAQFPKSLTADLNAVWSLDRDLPPEWSQVFEKKSSSKAFEEQVMRVGFGTAPIKAEGQQFSEDMGGEGWTARYVHTTVALMFALTQEAAEDNSYTSLGPQYVKELRRAMKETKEIMGANVFNNAFTVNGGDGVPLISTAHPLWGGGTASNKLATPADLAESSLEDVLIMIRNAVNERNLPTAVNATKLVTGNSNIFNAVRILRSQQRVGTPNNDINALRALGIFGNDPVTLTRLSDPDAWFVATDAPMGLQMFQRVGLEPDSWQDEKTGNFCYRARERYSFGYTNWRALWGSEGAA